MEKGKGDGKQGGGTTDPSTSDPHFAGVASSHDEKISPRVPGEPVYQIKDHQSKAPSEPLFRQVDRTPFWTDIAGVASSQGITSAQEHFPKVQLLANHFLIQVIDPSATITRCKVEIEVAKFSLSGGFEKVESTEKLDPKKRSEMRFVVARLFSQHPVDFPPDNSVYNGSEYIFSAKTHNTGRFRVNVPGKPYYYIINVVDVDSVDLSKLQGCFSGSQPTSGKDRDILFQGLDSLMKEIPARSMIRVRRNFHKKDSVKRLRSGAAVHTGLKQSLKMTSQGPALCLDYVAVLFYKTDIVTVLQNTIDRFKRVEDLRRFKSKVETELKGLKVQTTHTNLKYTFFGLTCENTSNLGFDIVKKDEPTKRTPIVDYFRNNYQREITYTEIPCLILRRKDRNCYMPFELCKLAEGQMYPDQKLSVLAPHERKKAITETVNDLHGVRHGSSSNGVFSENFGIQLTTHMTVVDGGLINPPLLKLKSAGGRWCDLTVNQDICDWNYSVRHYNFAEGKSVESWALVDLANVNARFIEDLQLRSHELGMNMAKPVEMRRYSSMHDISSIADAVRGIVDKCKNRPLQVIIFTIPPKYKYYGYLKWLLETKMGVISQCCLSAAYGQNVEKKNKFLDNLCLKINGKLGGSNVELGERLPHFTETDLVMFIGADVNHPAAGDNTSSSIAAVVGTVNWPAANRYVARIEPQECRSERIQKFAAMCMDLVNTFSKSNEGRIPDKIVVFRDGVGEGQFDMVLTEEIGDLKRAIGTVGWEPKITVVLAQKRHHTRFFRRLRIGNMLRTGNMLPGTVVDTVIVNPFRSNFFLCSHHGSWGTSKPVHYLVLLDENNFPSHDLQKLIYHLCFTNARCTQPVSLVPPVYYADRVATRGRVYYNAAKEESDANPLENCCKLHPDVENTMFFI